MINPKPTVNPHILENLEALEPESRAPTKSSQARRWTPGLRRILPSGHLGLGF